MLKPTNTAGPSVGGAPIAESPWTSFTDATGIAIFHSFGAIRNKITTWAHRHRGAYTGLTHTHPTVDLEESKPEYGPPTGALIGLNDDIYWCQPKVWGIRVADAGEITTWRGRINAKEFPVVLKNQDGKPEPIVVSLRTHAWHYPQVILQDEDGGTYSINEERQALYAIDDRNGKIILVVGDEPIYDTEPEKIYQLTANRYAYEWVERSRKPIYINGKRQKIIGSRFEARFDPEGWEPRWFRHAT